MFLDNKKLWVICSIVFSYLLHSSAAVAFENYAECKILNQKISESFAQLSLDEPFLRTTNRFGFHSQHFEDGTIQIDKVHPELADKIWEEYDEAVINNEWLTKVNGTPIVKMTDEKWDEYTDDAETITLEFEGYQQKFVLTKENYSSLNIDDYTLDIDNISQIDTKSSEFHTKFKTTTTWRDERLILIAKSILEGSPDPNWGNFFCNLDIKKWSDLNLFIPSINIDNFETKIDEKQQSLLFYYDSTDEYCDDIFDCSDNELNNGIAYYELQTEYIGKISDVFFMQKFPFDKQYLRFSVQSDYSANQWNDIDIDVSEWSQGFLESAVTNLHRPEWDFISYDQNFGFRYDDYSFQFLQTTNFDFEVQRKSAYFVYKLILPIIFLIALSWMVFFIKIKELESRLTISVVCFLSLIAYNFVVDDSLPKLGYLTFMDIFILVSYLFSGLPTIQTVVVEFYSENKGVSLSAKLDSLFRRYYFITYVFALLIIVIYFDLTG